MQQRSLFLAKILVSQVSASHSAGHPCLLRGTTCKACTLQPSLKHTQLLLIFLFVRTARAVGIVEPGPSGLPSKKSVGDCADNCVVGDPVVDCVGDCVEDCGVGNPFGHYVGDCVVGDSNGDCVSDCVVGDSVGDCVGGCVVRDSVGDCASDIVVRDSVGDYIGDYSVRCNVGDSVGACVSVYHEVGISPKPTYSSTWGTDTLWYVAL